MNTSLVQSITIVDLPTLDNIYWMEQSDLNSGRAFKFAHVYEMKEASLLRPSDRGKVAIE